MDNNFNFIKSNSFDILKDNPDLLIDNNVLQIISNIIAKGYKKDNIQHIRAKNFHEFLKKVDCYAISRLAILEGGKFNGNHFLDTVDASKMLIANEIFFATSLLDENLDIFNPKPFIDRYPTVEAEKHSLEKSLKEITAFGKGFFRIFFLPNYLSLLEWQLILNKSEINRKGSFECLSQLRDSLINKIDYLPLAFQIIVFNEFCKREYKDKTINKLLKIDNKGNRFKISRSAAWDISYISYTSAYKSIKNQHNQNQLLCLVSDDSGFSKISTDLIDNDFLGGYLFNLKYLDKDKYQKYLQFKIRMDIKRSNHVINLPEYNNIIKILIESEDELSSLINQIPDFKYSDKSSTYIIKPNLERINILFEIIFKEHVEQFDFICKEKPFFPGDYYNLAFICSYMSRLFFKGREPKKIYEESLGNEIPNVKNNPSDPANINLLRSLLILNSIEDQNDFDLKNLIKSIEKYINVDPSNFIFIYFGLLCIAKGIMKMHLDANPELVEKEEFEKLKSLSKKYFEIAYKI